MTMTDPYETESVDAVAGGHVMLAPSRDGQVSLLTSKANGHPGPTLLTQDEMRSVIAMLERLVDA